MNNSIHQRAGTGRFVARCISAGLVYGFAVFAGLLHAAGEVTEIQTTDQPGTPSSYSIDGRTYTWGMGDNQIMEGFTSDSVQYSFTSTADRVELIRHDVHNVSSGNPCGVFVERLGAGSEILKANYPSDGSDTGNCDMGAMLSGRVVNRGALDLFSNTGPNPKNVERVDYIYDRGLLAPLTSSSLSKSGHVVAEKSGNNPLQIAAITSIDILGQPSSFGPLVMVDRNTCADPVICYGITNLRHNYSFFQNNSLVPQGYPSFLKDSTESVGMAFVSLDKLGLSDGQVYYGFSYFPDDVDASVHTLTDVSTFPQDTNDETILFGDGPDIYGGVSGYFLADSLSVASGTVFKDENGDGLVNDNEAGISDVGLTLHQDSNGNGVFDSNEDAQLGPRFDSNISGNFNIPGLEDGVYFLLLDESDTDIPAALSVAPGTNPVMIVINGNDADGINFGFISDTGPTDAGAGDAGSDAGNSDAGAGDAGSDAGNSDSGGSDAGADAGNSDAGAGDAGSDAGNSDAGAGDAGSDAGNSDAGASDAGSDAGNTDAGGSDSGSDAGNSDAGASDAGSDAGSSDAGASDAGSDAGSSDAGASDAGSDAGNTDAGASDAGSDAGNTDSGASDAGSDAGNTDAGASDAGSDAGNTDAGASDAGSDAGNTDSGASDAGSDAGASDAGSTDSGSTDAGTGNEFIVINDGANATVANPDAVTVNHGASVDIFVLTNDSDAAGLGLTIVENTESANAEIELKEGFFTYKPEFGFNGMDSFLYTIEDAAGTRATGTVTVNVLRFSDINNNGENDFEECQCESLTIEVGVEGSALGSSSLYTFVLLWFFYGVRRHVYAKRERAAGVAQ